MTTLARSWDNQLLYSVITPTCSWNNKQQQLLYSVITPTCSWHNKQQLLLYSVTTPTCSWHNKQQQLLYSVTTPTCSWNNKQQQLLYSVITLACSWDNKKLLYSVITSSLAQFARSPPRERRIRMFTVFFGISVYSRLRPCTAEVALRRSPHFFCSFAFRVRVSPCCSTRSSP